MMFTCRRHGRQRLGTWYLCALIAVASAFSASPLFAQTVTATVNVNSLIATVPEYGMGIHASVYDNSLQYQGSAVFSQLDGLLDAAGVNTLRYPGGGYADIFHFSLARPSWESGITGSGLTPWWGTLGNYGYVASQTDFGNFVKLLDATNSKTVITVNTGSALKYDNPNQVGIPTHAGQPQEAAAWVAYANADAGIYGTANDIALGVDAEGNDWKTAGYWAKLRASDTTEYQSWANSDGVYDSRNAFLAINRDQPVGIKYWEIGNETFGTGYYGGTAGQTGYAANYDAPYDGSPRDDNPSLSPAAYGQQVNDFTAAMKAVDSSIKTGAVLATPPGDYVWSYADLNDDGIKQASEPFWNDEVLSQTDPTLGKVADNVDFVIAHWYPNGSTTTIANHPRTTIPLMINGSTPGLDTGSNAGLRDSIASARTDGNSNALEIFITETDGGGSNEGVDGLFAADEYVTFFEHGVTNVDWLELHNGSFLSEASNTPNFAYWGIQSVHLLADVGDELVPTTTTEDDVRIHSSRRADGSVAVMVINMNAANAGGSRTVDISINGDTLSEDGVIYQTNGDTALSPTNLTNLGNVFTTTIAGRTLQLFVIPRLESLAGDFNGDHIVNAADYTVWRNGLGSIYTEDDYNVWKDNFGATQPGGGSAAAASVPEPSALLLCVVGLLAAVVTRRGISRHEN